MDQIRDFSDERNKAWCVHCGNYLATLETNRDHVPSKSLLLAPYPSDLPVIEVCKSCNSSFSQDEEYLAAFLSSVLAGTTDAAQQKIPVAKRILERNEKLGARIGRSQKSFTTFGGQEKVFWVPEQERINNVILKNARGHAMYEYGEPMLDKPLHIWSAPLEILQPEERQAFETIDFGGIYPEVGSRMMTRVFTGQDLLDGWVYVQDGVYRYAVTQDGGLRVKSVLFEYLATEVAWDA
jgi:hypothetical protein